MRRNVFLGVAVVAALSAGVAAVAPGCRPSHDADLDERIRILRSAASYLWSRQAPDGGWHSTTHGLLRGGETWTAFVSHYLLRVPDSVYSYRVYQREHAIRFIREHISKGGVLGISDPSVLEYPNYATSYALRVLQSWGARSDSTIIAGMREYLLSEQYDEGRGITPMHPAYGSWGFGETSLAAGEVGHVDLSHTRRLLEALAGSGVRPEHTSEALSFLAMLQKHPQEKRPQPGADEQAHPARYDGGFYASTVTLGLNKGGTVTDSTGRSYYPGYATATCDGILALLAAGVPRDDERVLRAAEWLEAHPDLTRVEGIPPNPGQWEHVMFYYHLLVRSEAYAALGLDGTWRDEMARILSERQRPDGSFSNPMGAPNKEDDPILATAMVIGTLINTL